MILIRHLIQISGSALSASFERQRRATLVPKIICAVMMTSPAGDANEEVSIVASNLVLERTQGTLPLEAAPP
jgi:hypothetical protein